MTVIQTASDFTVLERTCPFCGKIHSHKFPMSIDELSARTAKLRTMCIQNVFPELNADAREFLKTGICPECWANL